jgi:hypothetical protein
MLGFLKNTKLLGGLAVLVLAGGLLYYYYGSTDEVPAVSSESDASVASQELLLTLGGLNTIELNPALFSDPSFTALSDFGVVIPAQPTGRRNPFAPLGGN